MRKNKNISLAMLFTAGVILLLFIVINIRKVELYGDDFYYSQVIDIYGSFGNWFVSNYNVWSGRLIHGIYVLLLEGGVWPFRILNVPIMLGAVYLMFRLSCTDVRNIPLAVQPLLLGMCAFQMLNVAWIFEPLFWPVGMVLYCWGSTCMLFVLWTLQKLLQGHNLSAGRWVATFLCAGYACYFEQTAATLIGFLIVHMVLFLAARKPVPRLLWVLVAFSLINTMICLLAPGNAVRSDVEIIFHWPDYDTYGLVRKLALGVSFALETWAGVRLRYILIAAGMLGLANLLRRRWLETILSALPVGYFGLLVLGEWFPAVRQALPLTDYLAGNELFGTTSWQAFCTALGLGIFVLFALLLFLSGDDGPDLLSGFLALAAFANLLIMCFSPTIYASGSRCQYVSNLLINLVAIRQWALCLKTGWFQGWKGILAGIVLAGYAVHTLLPIL